MLGLRFFVKYRKKFCFVAARVNNIGYQGLHFFLRVADTKAKTHLPRRASIVLLALTLSSQAFSALLMAFLPRGEERMTRLCPWGMRNFGALSAGRSLAGRAQPVPRMGSGWPRRSKDAPAGNRVRISSSRQLPGKCARRGSMR